MKRIILILLVFVPLLGFSQKKVDARNNGKGNTKVSKGKDQTVDRNAEIAKDEERSWQRSRKIQDKKTGRKMERKRKKARKVAIMRANRNKGRHKFLGIF